MASQPWICTVKELADAAGGQVLSSPVSQFSFVGTDTRQDLKGRLFVPLKGENFDAHDFIAKAVDQGAVAILVHEWREDWQPLLSKAAFVRVPDTLQGLQALARFWRRKCAFKVLAITGSNGKTTTKEFAAALMKPHLRIHYSKGSFNNHWGVPLSILEAEPHHTHLILEMGMNHAGEIWRLCQIAEPDIVTVTTVGRAHIGELGSQAAVAQAKDEIYVSSPNAMKIFNMDNEWTIRMQTRAHGKMLKFSAFKTDVDIYLRANRVTWEGLQVSGQIAGVKGEALVHVLGRHNVVNLMAATGLALAAGLTPEQIWQDLGTQVRDSAWGRNQLLEAKSGVRIVFDAYNANPDSMLALIKNVEEMEIQGRKFLIVGDMKELGSFTESAHEEIGHRAGVCGFAGVWFLGQNSQAFERGLEKAGMPETVLTSADFDPAVAERFFNLMKEGDLVALKASRSMRLERVLEAWPLKTPLAKK